MPIKKKKTTSKVVHNDALVRVKKEYEKISRTFDKKKKKLSTSQVDAIKDVLLFIAEIWFEEMKEGEERFIGKAKQWKIKRGKDAMKVRICISWKQSKKAEYCDVFYVYDKENIITSKNTDMELTALLKIIEAVIGK